MKTLINTSDNVSLYYVDDDVDIDITAEGATASKDGTPILIMPMYTSNNSTVRDDVSEVSNYWARKYKHDGSSWSSNTDYKGTINLTSNINDSVTTIPVETSNPFTASGTVKIGNEKITYTGVDQTNLTGCTRGVESTSAASHIEESFVKQI